MSKALFIVFEGIDGSGKSTQVQQLAAWFRQQGQAAQTGFEPTNNTYGAKLRASATSGRLSAEEELELFIADRKQHLAETIEPTLANGSHMLVDRYYFSTMAYQGARGLDVAAIEQRHREFARQPDLVLWFDLPVEQALQRINQRGSANAFEKASSLQKCRDIFAAINYPWFVRIDASQQQEQVFAQVLEHIRQLQKQARQD